LPFWLVVCPESRRRVVEEMGLSRAQGTTARTFAGGEGLAGGGVQVHSRHTHLHLLRPEVMDTAAGEEALAEPGGLNGDLYRFEEKLEAR